MGTNWWISCVRTIVAPLLVGLLVQWAFDADSSFTWRSASLALVAIAYYSTARSLQMINPYFGFLLVVAAQPHYLEDGDDRNIDPFVISILRTGVSIIVGCVLAILMWLLLDFSSPAGLALQCVFTAVFYGGLRYVEERSVAGTRIREVAGRMLGAPLAPHY